jgi:hypothetical protein
MGNTTINGIVIHNGSNAVINVNTCAKDSTLTPQGFYLSDSDETDVFDFGGVVKTLNISGSYTASSLANLKIWIESIEALQQGHQDIDAGAPYTFVDDLRGTIKVKINSFDSTFNEGEVARATWNLKLTQSSENA